MKTSSADVKAIELALEKYYFKGLYDGDVNALAHIFNPGTLLFGDIKGQPYAKTLREYLDGVKNRQSPKDSGKPFESEILEIKVVNTIGFASVKIKMYDFYYQDFLSFHKISGEWLIVNKMLTDTNN